MPPYGGSLPVNCGKRLSAANAPTAPSAQAAVKVHPAPRDLLAGHRCLLADTQTPTTPGIPSRRTIRRHPIN